MQNILITGGAGFIGSHICLDFLEQQKNVYVLDSYINSKEDVFNGIRKILLKKQNFDVSKLTIYKGDIRDHSFLNKIFLEAKERGNPIDGVIHCAGLKAVNESIYNPLKYWDFNVSGSINLLKVMLLNQCRTILFSSSATVYGISEIPSSENANLEPINPYGLTKLAVESILQNISESKNDKWKVGYLRYFNPIGAHPSGLIGENPLSKPNNIFPLICQVAAGLRDKFYVFGNDWQTIDGTCHRDYLHIVDLAVAHRIVMEHLFKKDEIKLVLNVGRGESISVLNLIKTFERVNNVKINYEFAGRRQGDAAISLADTKEMRKILNWKPEKTIEDMCRDGWKWQLNNLK